MSKQELDRYHYHEAIDRVEMLREILENSVSSHVVIDTSPELKKLADKVEDSLSMLYNGVSNETDKKIKDGTLIVD